MSNKRHHDEPCFILHLPLNGILYLKVNLRDSSKCDVLEFKE